MKKIFILGSLVLILALSACGKVAKPVPYQGSGYPHSYPYDQQ